MAETKRSPAEDTSGREIVISRVLDAPRELVWEAWTDPKHVVQWWGPRGFTTTIHEMDVRPGGVWRHTMHGPDGTDYPNKSVFIEVVKPERIVFSHAGGKKGAPGAHFQSTWTFEAQGGKTRLTMRMAFASAAERDQIVKVYGAIEGGNQTLDRLEEQMAQVPVIVERTFDAPVGSVWKAITDIDQMKQWYFPALDSFKPEVGFETQFNIRHEGKDYLHIWKVTEVAPEKKIAYEWKFGGIPGDSFVTIELFSEGNKTRLKLTHKGLETFLPKTNPDLARGNFVQGWEQIIGTSLGQFLGKAGAATEPELFLARIFDAPRDLVWKAWTDPKHLAQWWGPQGFTNPVCEVDVRPGGAILIHMRGPDGIVYPMTGVYQEIVEPERLVFTSSALNKEGQPMFEVLTTATFTQQGGKTKLTLEARVARTTSEAAPYLAGMKAGWTQSLERLAEHVVKI